jgi:hypothetical protein
MKIGKMRIWNYAPASIIYLVWGGMGEKFVLWMRMVFLWMVHDSR